MGIVYFVGGEDGDFMKTSSGCSVDTTTTAGRRTAYARCALKASSYNREDGWVGKFAGPATSFWFSSRIYFDFGTGSSSGTNSVSPAFLDANGIVRLGLTCASWSGSSQLDIRSQPLQLVKVNAAGTRTVLAQTATAFAWPWRVLSKLDIQVSNYGVNGTVNIYFGNVLVLTFTGDLTTDGITAISGVRVGQISALADTYLWSEVMVTSVDTRTLTLGTMALAAAGNSYAWQGPLSNINELTLDDATIAYSTASGQILQGTVTNTVVPSYAGVLSVIVNARAQKGNTGGPANCNLMLRTGGADYTSPSQALPTGSFDLVQYSWDTNPANSAIWTPTDLTAAAFNIGIKSLT